MTGSCSVAGFSSTWTEAQMEKESESVWLCPVIFYWQVGDGSDLIWALASPSTLLLRDSPSPSPPDLLSHSVMPALCSASWSWGHWRLQIKHYPLPPPPLSTYTPSCRSCLCSGLWTWAFGMRFKCWRVWEWNYYFMFRACVEKSHIVKNML